MLIFTNVHELCKCKVKIYAFKFSEIQGKAGENLVEREAKKSEEQNLIHNVHNCVKLLIFKHGLDNWFA